MKHAASAAITLLLACSTTLAETVAATPNPNPNERHYLDLQHSYSLQGLGVDLAIAASRSGEVTISSASQGRMWRLQDDQLLPFASQAQCPQGQRLWPSAIADAGVSAARLWLLDMAAQRVQEISADGRSLACYSVASLLPGSDRRLAADDGSDQHLMMTIAPSQTRPTLRPLPTGMAECAAATVTDTAAPHPGSATLYCINAQRNRVLGFRHKQPVASFTLPGSYPRAAGLALAEDGTLMVSDAARARLYRLDPAMQQYYRLPLYERQFRSPGRLRVSNGTLWLIDEGSQQLLQFAMRQAHSVLDHRLLGEEFLSLGLYAQALTELQRGGAGPLLLGQAYYGLADYPQALAQFTAATADSNDQVLANFWRANALFRMDQLDAALTTYQQVAHTAGQLALPAAINHAQTLLALARYAQAERAFIALLGQAPRHPAIRLGAALAALGRNEYAPAIAALTALQVDPLVGRQARHYLGLAQLAAGNAQLALPLLQQAAREGPHFRQALAALARAQTALGQTQQALQTRTILSDLPQRSAALDAFILEDQQP